MNEVQGVEAAFTAPREEKSRRPGSLAAATRDPVSGILIERGRIVG